MAAAAGGTTMMRDTRIFLTTRKQQDCTIQTVRTDGLGTSLQIDRLPLIRPSFRAGLAFILSHAMGGVSLATGEPTIRVAESEAPPLTTSVEPVARQPGSGRPQAAICRTPR